ncbi:uncharacterized protein LOC130013996 [Patella vulgata]|uniref:uncharacterized protein LOC130013996 n=1 Tax=Patella vulgata TaxID=6465 RepID=UPI0024A7AA5E|nr:uncharacterized protein LOC130013996 [Patella vulgata]XP_055958675.1 uncharacterized protein LOC130013996 [Patella vulgata]
MLSKEEVVYFLTDVLEIKDVEVLLESLNKLDLINTIMASYREKEPFQNIILMATDPNERHRPTWNEIKRGMFLKQGGLCYSHHIFLFALFKALNVDVAMVHSTVTSPNNHLVIIAKNVLKTKDAYLLEAGCGYPTFRIISLDFEEESPIFFDSFLEYKLVRFDGKILRMHRKGDMRPPKDVDTSFYIGEWRRFYDFDLNENENVQDFDEVFHDVYTNPDRSPFHKSFRFVSFRDQKTQILVNKKSLIENDQHELETTKFESDGEIIKCLNSFTNAIDESCVRKALDNWRKSAKSCQSLV